MRSVVRAGSWVIDLEHEALMHLRVDHQAGGVERSANILYSAMFQAPGSVLSARKQMTGSLGCSSKDSSA
jgi:hypothetical protein